MREDAPESKVTSKLLSLVFVMRNQHASVHGSDDTGVLAVLKYWLLAAVKS
jgi:hypothetical protein